MASDLESSDVYSLDTLINSDDTIWHFDGSFIKSPYNTAWAYFVDDCPFANWVHPCRYIFVNATNGNYQLIYSELPPEHLDFTPLSLFPRPVPASYDYGAIETPMVKTVQDNSLHFPSKAGLTSPDFAIRYEIPPPISAKNSANALRSSYSQIGCVSEAYADKFKSDPRNNRQDDVNGRFLPRSAAFLLFFWQSRIIPIISNMIFPPSVFRSKSAAHCQHRNYDARSPDQTG